MYGKKKKAKGYAKGGYVEKDKDQMPMTKEASTPRREPKSGAMFGSQPARPA